MSCSIRRIVTPASRIRRMSRISSRVSVGFMPAAGSSRSRSRGSAAGAEADPPVRRLVETRDQVEAGRLPGAVGPDQADDLALLDPERKIVHGPEAAEVLRQAFGLEERHPPGPPPRPRLLHRDLLHLLEAGPLHSVEVDHAAGHIALVV